MNSIMSLILIFLYYLVVCTVPLVLRNFIEKEYEKEQRIKNAADRNIYDLKGLWEYYSVPAYVKEDSSGYERLRNLINTLNLLDRYYRRSKQQREFHKIFISSLLTKIFGDDIYQHYAALCREFELDSLNPNTLIVTPRRFGKTTAVALFCAAYLYTQPQAKIVVYSTGRRLSVALLNLTRRIIEFLNPKNLSCNQEVLTIQNKYGEAKLSSYPSNENIGELRFFFIIFFFLLSLFFFL